MLQRGEMPKLRQIASATRLRGPLKLEVLRRALAEIISRQDALRTRVVVCNGIPTQEIAQSGCCEIQVEDLTGLSESIHESEVNRQIRGFILESVDVSVGPLFGILLLKLRHDEHVLIAAMEHMISDEFSMNILLRDLFTAYVQALNGHTFHLPQIHSQFTDYATRQTNAYRSWLEKNGAYCNDHLAGSQRVRFPEDRSLQTVTRLGWGTVGLKIGKTLRAELGEWCLLRRTTIVMAVFTAYVALVLRWCNAPECVVQYLSNGRTSPDVENTIGFFASPLYLRVALFDDDGFVELMSRVTEEYCKAYERAAFCHVAQQVPPPEFTRNTIFNWVPQGTKIRLSETDASEHAITCSPVPFTHPMADRVELDHEPGILLYDIDDEVVGLVHFPLNRFSIEIMERFARNVLVFVSKLLEQPEVRVNDILLL
jgi:hypothetical protein